MKISKSVFIIILILVGIIIFQRITVKQIKPKQLPPDTIYQRYDSTIYIPKPYLVYKDTGTHSISIIHDSIVIPSNVDTIAILADYLRKRIYGDTTYLDSLGYIFIEDTVQYNRITSRKKIIHVFLIKKSIMIKRHNQWLIGFSMGGNLNRFEVFGDGMIINKRGNAYGVSIDPFNKIILGRLLWTIKFKKRNNDFR